MTENGYKIRRPLSESQAGLMKSMLSEVSRPDYRAVSFRMEDVLVLMPFSSPEDMFALMEEDFSAVYAGKKFSFAELRTAAGDEAEKRYSSSGAVTLDRIYDILEKKSKISPDSRRALQKRECELMAYFAFPRSLGKALFDEAKKHRKKVIVTADTPYPRSVVVRILSNCGYETCDELVLPRELHIAGKDKESVFGAILQKAGVLPGKLVHIGGSVEADVEVPITKGAKALLISPVVPMMIKSGRLRGFVQHEHIYDIDDSSLLMLRCAFALYAAYGFDVPRNKLPQSDFCGDGYMLGFIVLGTLALAKDFVPENELQRRLLAAIESDERSAAGRDDFATMFDSHFADFLNKFGSRGCSLPFKFLEKYSAVGDRELLRGTMEPSTLQQWSDSSSEPETAPVYGRKIKQNAAEKLADKLFPPGTKVRNISDTLLMKMKGGKF